MRYTNTKQNKMREGIIKYGHMCSERRRRTPKQLRIVLVTIVDSLLFGTKQIQFWYIASDLIPLYFSFN